MIVLLLLMYSRHSLGLYSEFSVTSLLPKGLFFFFPIHVCAVPHNILMRPNYQVGNCMRQNGASSVWNYGLRKEDFRLVGKIKRLMFIHKLYF